MKLDMKFIQFYISAKCNKNMEDYFHVQKSTVSNWRKRGFPEKYIDIFIDREGSSDIYILLGTAMNVKIL